MKTKTILLAALVGAATVSANAGVNFGISIGLPLPVVYTQPAMVVVPATPAPCVETIPACPGVNYVWAPGYWSYRGNRYAWVHGGWNIRPVHVYHAHRW